METILDKCFTYCTNLNKIELPQKLKYIGKEAFSYSALNEIFIPKSVNFIGKNCFYNTNNPTFYTNIGNKEKLKGLLISSGVSNPNIVER